MKLSECHLKLDSKHEAASALVDAANAYKKTNKKGASLLCGHHTRAAPQPDTVDPLLRVHQLPEQGGRVLHGPGAPVHRGQAL